MADGAASEAKPVEHLMQDEEQGGLQVQPKGRHVFKAPAPRASILGAAPVRVFRAA
jgi:hypothetical protein